MIYKFQITETTRKNRLDKFLYDNLTDFSRMYLNFLVKDGKCVVNGANQERGYHLQAGDKIEIEVDTTKETAMKPENIALDIIFEDAEILVVNKPAEMLVHPTKGVRSGTLLNALTYYFNFAGDEKPLNFVRAGLIHRLDKKTSGLLVIGKNSRSHRILCSHFQRKLVEKRYYALVEGSVANDFGTINAPIGHNVEEKFWHITADGKPAETRFRVLERFADKTLLELEPVTGRTNQLRLHCAYIKHPIIGDDKYGGREFQRLCLHAYKLSFFNPTDNQKIEFETALPEDFYRR